MQRSEPAYALHLTFGEIGSPSTPLGSTLIVALQWMAACLLSALIYWALITFVFQRRNRLPATNRGALYAALLLVTVAGSTLFVESRAVALREPLFWALVPILFVLFFYLFCDKRYVPRWVNVLMIVSTFSFLAAFFPQQPSPNPPALPILQVSGILGALQTLSDMFSVMLAVVGIAPQIYYRYRHFVLTGERRYLRLRVRGLSFGVLAIGSFLTLIASAALSQSSQTPSLVRLTAETGFYLLVALLPVAASFTVLHRRHYDRAAFINRLLAFGLLTLCLLLIYVGCLLTLWVLFPGFSGLATVEYLPFFILTALLMALAFRPLQAGIQERIDRHFYPRRYAGARHLATFNATLRKETQLDTLCHQVIAVIEKSLLPSSVVLWLPTSSGWGTSRGSGGGPPTTSRRHASQETSTAELRLHRQAETGTLQLAPATLVVAPDDPALAMLLRPLSILDIDQQPSRSAVMRTLLAADLVLLLPLVSRGELVGVLALGQRQPVLPAKRYTYDDCEILTLLAELAAPVVSQAHLLHMQEVEERQRERVEQELQTARRIQEALLPKAVPVLAGWQIATCYRPARAVGGDFYDFLSLGSGRLGIVLGDVTDKGIPAALVMATTRSMLRAVAAQSATSPGQVLAQVNELLAADLPASMFVTCFYAILDPATGRLWYANAGQDLPYVRHTDGTVDELRARGMPLGLMPDMEYEELETTLLPGDSLLFYSDGLVEAHNPQHEMFGFPRLMAKLREPADGTSPISHLLEELATFTGADWEQEDDLTLVILQRAEDAAGDEQNTPSNSKQGASRDIPRPLADHLADEAAWRTLAEWTMNSLPGNERQALQRIADAVRDLNLQQQRLERLQTAVGEAIMNAMEHGNHYRPDLLVAIQVQASRAALMIRITDDGGNSGNLDMSAWPTPDLEAKLAGLQSPRGWGMFLMKNLVDEVRVTSDTTPHTVELMMFLDESTDFTSDSSHMPPEDHQD